MRSLRPLFYLAFGWLLWAAMASAAHAQSFGTELHNTMMPTAGAMGGVSIARPQDVLSSLNANPATLTHFRGTEFVFSSGWAEATFKLDQTGNAVLPGITPFSAKSKTPGSALLNIGVSQEMLLFDMPITAGLGLVSTAGAGVDFRGIPASNNTSSQLLVLEVASGVGMKLTDRLSVGGNVQLGSGFYDGPFVSVGAMVPAYGVRFTTGLNYDVTPDTSLGLYWQSKQNFRFDDAITLNLFGGALDITRPIYMDLPENVGIGLANRSLMDGRLLLGVDVLFKNWEGADLYKSVYRGQWVFQFGSQYSFERLRLRAGYVYAENPVKPITVTSAGGITPPGGFPALQYTQALLSPAGDHRISGGVGVVDVLPGIDLDTYAGGAFPQSQQFGAFTSTNVAVYWVGAGITWRPGRGRVETRLSK